LVLRPLSPSRRAPLWLRGLNMNRQLDRLTLEPQMGYTSSMLAKNHQTSLIIDGIKIIDVVL
jgi:hypothetical protein